MTISTRYMKGFPAVPVTACGNPSAVLPSALFQRRTPVPAADVLNRILSADRLTDLNCYCWKLRPWFIEDP